MHNVTTVELRRDCEAVQIPVGNTVTLPAGTSVDITQTLGGAYTVHAMGGLFRVAAKDVDALGLDESAAAAASAAGTGTTGPGAASAGGPLNEQAVWEVLRSCYDPEIPVNIVDLGLVYDLAIEPTPSGRSRVAVKMTLTAPGCGMGGVIARDAQERLLLLDGVDSADVEIVWDPPWHQSMISAEGRRILGLE